MKVNNYQSGAISTAIYPHTYSLVYPVLGLCGEVGELIDAVILDETHGKGIDERDSIKKEAGDVLWYVANVANDMGVLLCEVMDQERFPEYMGPWDIDDVIAELPVHTGMVAECVKKAIRDEGGKLTDLKLGKAMTALRWVVNWLGRLVSNYEITLEECAQLNLDKLRSRAERGVIKGEGNNR